MQKENSLDLELRLLRTIAERESGATSIEITPMELDVLFLKKQGKAWLKQDPINPQRFMFTDVAKQHLGW